MTKEKVKYDHINLRISQDLRAQVSDSHCNFMSENSVSTSLNAYIIRLIELGMKASDNG